MLPFLKGKSCTCQEHNHACKPSSRPATLPLHRALAKLNTKHSPLPLLQLLMKTTATYGAAGTHRTPTWLWVPRPTAPFSPTLWPLPSVMHCMSTVMHVSAMRKHPDHLCMHQVCGSRVHPLRAETGFKSLPEPSHNFVLKHKQGA